MSWTYLFRIQSGLPSSSRPPESQDALQHDTDDLTDFWGGAGYDCKFAQPRESFERLEDVDIATMGRQVVAVTVAAFQARKYECAMPRRSTG